MEFCKQLTQEDNLYQYIVYLENINKVNLILEHDVIYFATLYKEWVGTELLGIFTSYEEMEKEFDLNNYDYDTYEDYYSYHSRPKSGYCFEEYNKYEKVYTKDLILYGIPSMYRYFIEHIELLKRLLNNSEEKRQFYQKEYKEIYKDAAEDILEKIEISYYKLKKELYQ